jgi:tyrosine-protein kinase Etk/Wzc
MSSYTNNNNVIKKNNPEDSGINVRQLLQRLRRMWYVFLIFPLLTGALAWLYLRYQQPIYEVKSSILIKDEKNKQGISATDLISKEFGLSGTKKQLIDESKIMTSFNVMEAVVKDLKLDRTIYHRGTFVNRELYGNNAPLSIDTFLLKDTVKNFKANVDIIDDKQFVLTTPDDKKYTQTFGEAFMNEYGYFVINKRYNTTQSNEKAFTVVCKGTETTAREIIKTVDIVLPKKESNILEPTIKTTVPEKAKDILTKMVNIYNAFNLNDKRTVSQNTLDFIDKRLVSLTTELSGVELTVEEYKTKEGITADATSDINYLFSRMGEYDGELVKLEVQNSLLESIESILKKGELSFDLLPTNMELKSTSLQGQIADYNKLILERNRMAKVAGESNPELKSLTEDVKSIKNAIIGNIGRVKQENASLLSQTKAKNNQFKSSLGSTPRKERELTEIKRQQNIKQGLYLFLLQKQEETAISMVGAIADARIVDRPITSEKPVSKGKSIIYAMSIAAGLGLGLLFVILQGLFVNTIQSETDITAHTLVPIIAKIPHTKTNTNWVVQAGSHSPAAEMFRLLRSNLQFVLGPKAPQSKGQLILISSSNSGEGKSFITLNLGMSLAIANKRTVIIGLDLRRPKLNEDFPSLKGELGITNYLTSDIQANEIIKPSGKHKDLYFIPSGPLPPNPAELLMQPKLGKLLNYLKEHADYIIIDTPPVGLVSDAMSLKPYVDMTLLVVRQDFTKISQLNIIQEFHGGQKLPKPSIVFNSVKWSEEYGNYGYYGPAAIEASNGHKSPLQKLKKVFS